MGSYLTSFSDDGASMGDAASNNFDHYVVFDMFSDDKFSQQNGEMQFTLSWHFSYTLLSEANKGTK